MAPPDKQSVQPENSLPQATAAPAEDAGKTMLQQESRAERSALAADQAEANAAGRREELKDEVYDFTEGEKEKYKKAFGKDVEPKALASITLDELSAAEIKEPGITKILFKKKEKEANTEKFTTHNNHDVEWQKGLKDLVDENVSEITLYIHPKNLTKAANKAFLESNQAAKNAYAAYQETPPRIIFFERKSTKREGGNFYNDDGYLRIFDGDTWKIEKTRSEEVPAAKVEKAQPSVDTAVEDKHATSVQAQGAERKVEPTKSTDSTTIRGPLADKMSDSRKLSEGRKEMARKIEEKFLAAGLSKEIA
ncbi:MAG: hypothetical protein NTX63_04880, partial [Candidatus Peregrinibacteria bacterium]|nr:hypothetical protein [Candidatus Peregrinibacteria bacterium]